MAADDESGTVAALSASAEGMSGLSDATLLASVGFQSLPGLGGRRPRTGHGQHGVRPGGPRAQWPQ